MLLLRVATCYVVLVQHPYHRVLIACSEKNSSAARGRAGVLSADAPPLPASRSVITNAYEKYNFPGTKRLFELLSNDGYKITIEEIKAFLDEQEPEQILIPVIMPQKKS